jgi:hypothetical protein
MCLARSVEEKMGLEWLIDAADGKFVAGKSVGVSDLQKLINTRRQEQGIS